MLKTAVEAWKNRSLSGFCLILSLLPLPTVVVIAGCSQPPPAAVSNQRLEEDQVDPRRQLTTAERDEIRRSMAVSAQGHVVQEKAARPPQPGGARWSDVELALAYAADDAEMAALAMRAVPDGWFVQLKTIDDRPVEMTITRTGDASVYRAAATVGRFGDDQETARRLLELFDRYMKAFGEKQALNP